MRIFRGFSRPVPGPTAVAIGNFDGVHRGHGALLGRLGDVAREFSLPATILTFE
ncbi:MAG: bifunctional riboflavin kinase/FAD synthetase, partial [Azonexus sp.]